METILEKEQYILLYRTSYLSLLSSLYAVYTAQYIISIVPGSVFLTSILYWYKPDYSWRRYLDMTVVKIALIYQYYIAHKYRNAVAYYAIMTPGLLFYPISIYYYSKNEYWKSTYSHMTLHLIGNISNIILYSGRMVNEEF